jgi:hypothetical protein
MSDATYPKLMLSAKRALSSGDARSAASLANEAMRFAMFTMMEPVNSRYVQDAKNIRDIAFSAKQGKDT